MVMTNVITHYMYEEWIIRDSKQHMVRCNQSKQRQQHSNNYVFPIKSIRIYFMEYIQINSEDIQLAISKA